MGIFKKIKDIFYDEEIVEVPVTEEKKEVVKNEPPVIEEITSPIDTKFKFDDEEEKPNDFSERELFKPEKTFDFPVFDEDEEETVKTRSKVNVLELQKELEQRSMTSRNKSYETKETLESKKESTFKPSPVISPVYGILDKNYRKEEVVTKKEVKSQNLCYFYNTTFTNICQTFSSI